MGTLSASEASMCVSPGADVHTGKKNAKRKYPQGEGENASRNQGCDRAMRVQEGDQRVRGGDWGGCVGGRAKQTQQHPQKCHQNLFLWGGRR